MKTNTDHSNLEISKELEVIVKFLQQSKMKRSYVDAMNAAFYLWEHYDVDVKEIVVKVLKKVETIPNGKERLKEEFGKNAQRRRLLHDPRLRDVAPEINPPRHRWPVLEQPFFLSKQDGPEQKWLEAWELIDNPFGTSNLISDPFTIKSFVSPFQWNEYTNMTSRIFSSPEFQDRQVVVQNICKEYSNSKDADIFVITKTLPFVELDKGSSRFYYFTSLAKLVSEYWIEYLTDLYEDDTGTIICSTDFLDLKKEDQDELAAFLAWACGSTEKLLDLLQGRGLREYKNGRKLLEVMDRIVQNKTNLPCKVPEKQLFTWLQLRPPGRDSFVLLFNFPEQDNEGIAETQGWNLVQLTDTLAELGIVLKLFSSDEFLPPNPFQKIPLRWDNADLQSMLSSRLQNVSNGITSLDEFFGPVVVNCEEQFLDAANGSLTALLRLCNKLLDFHCASDDESIYFSEAEVDAVFKS